MTKIICFYFTILVLAVTTTTLAQYIKPKLMAENTDFSHESRKHKLVDSWLNILPAVITTLRSVRDNNSISHNDVLCSLQNMMTRLGQRMNRCPQA